MLCRLRYTCRAQAGPRNYFLVEEYTLPDGRVKLGGERFEASEALSNPTLSTLMDKVLLKWCFFYPGGDIDMRPELYKHIVLSGGSTMYPGLPSRLEREIKQHYLERVLKAIPRDWPSLKSGSRTPKTETWSHRRSSFGGSHEGQGWGFG